MLILIKITVPPLSEIFMKTYVKSAPGFSYTSPDGNASGWDVIHYYTCEFCRIDVYVEGEEDVIKVDGYELCKHCAKQYEQDQINEQKQ